MNYRHQLKQALNQRCYKQFSSAYQRLLQHALASPKARHDLFVLHNQLTHGATRRILRTEQADPHLMQVSETRFKLFLDRQQGATI